MSDTRRPGEPASARDFAVARWLERLGPLAEWVLSIADIRDALDHAVCGHGYAEAWECFECATTALTHRQIQRVLERVGYTAERAREEADRAMARVRMSGGPA